MATATIAAHAEEKSVSVTGINETLVRESEGLRLQVARAVALAAVDALHGEYQHGLAIGRLVDYDSRTDTKTFQIVKVA